MSVAEGERSQSKLEVIVKAKKGLLTKAKVDECFGAWKNHAETGNSYKLLQRMELYYKKLWEE